MIAKDYLKKMNGGANTPKTDLLSDKTEAGRIGAVIGAVLGVYVGYTRSYNLLISAFLGGLAGNLMTKVLLRPKKEEKNESDD